MIVWVAKIQMKMIYINCLLQQMFSNLFKIDAIAVQIAPYRSLMIVNEISSL